MIIQDRCFPMIMYKREDGIYHVYSSKKKVGADREQRVASIRNRFVEQLFGLQSNKRRGSKRGNRRILAVNVTMEMNCAEADDYAERMKNEGRREL